MVKRYYGGVMSATQVNAASNSGFYNATQQMQAKQANNWPLPPSPGTQKAIFGYGYASAYVSITNLVSNTGVVAADVTGVGTPRNSLAAAGYGGDKAIFGYTRKSLQYAKSAHFSLIDG